MSVSGDRQPLKSTDQRAARDGNSKENEFVLVSKEGKMNSITKKPDEESVKTDKDKTEETYDAGWVDVEEDANVCTNAQGQQMRYIEGEGGSTEQERHNLSQNPWKKAEKEKEAKEKGN